MTKNNQIENCTFPVPTNALGIFALHCEDNQPISSTDLKNIIDGPISQVESDLRNELLKPTVLKKPLA